MSDRQLSRAGPIFRLPLNTAEDLKEAVRSDQTLGKRKKEARIYGINVICGGIGQQPAAVPIARLRKAAREINPANCGVSFRTLQNCLSQVRRALTAYRADVIDTRSVRLDADWQNLINRTGDASVGKSCSRFARWATEMGLAPMAIDTTTAQRYFADLQSRMETRCARRSYLTFCRGWNRAAATFPQIWPQITFTPDNRRKVYALASAEVASSFLIDLEAMLDAFSSRLKLPKGWTSPFEPRTIAELRRIVLRLYTVAVKLKSPPVEITSLADLVRVDTAEGILDHYLTWPEEKGLKSAHKYAHFLLLIARYWVKAPTSDLEELAQFRRSTMSRAKGMTEKNQATMRHFNDYRVVGKLLEQGRHALRKFKACHRPTTAEARQLQTALAVELLIAAPVRSQNLASIDLNRHLLTQRVGRRQTITLCFPAREVKNDENLEFPLPKHVVELLDFYVQKARPLLACEGNVFLFPGKGLKHKAPSLLSKQIAERTLRSLGVRVTAHQFRHLAGHLFLSVNPGAHEIVRQLLGHVSIETTIGAYAGMEKAAAVAHYDQFVSGIRSQYVDLKPGKKLSRHLPKT